MRIEWLVAFYLFVSVAMILFNFVFLAYEKARAKRFVTKTKRLASDLSEEIERNADFPTEAHKRILERKLRKLSGMESFDLTMQRLQELDPEKSDRYLRGIAAVFHRLTYYFAKKPDLKKAYFAYILKRWYRLRPASDTVTQTLLRFVREGSFYVRQNSLEALASVADACAFADAVELIERGDDFHHPKLVTEAALSFAGDADGLVAELTARFDGLRPATQAAVINYLRMSGKGDRVRLLQLLKDDDAHLEVRLACVRYFMRNYWDPAEEPLRRLALTDDPARWEYAAVAATALASYPSMETLEALKRCLSSTSWFVRNNAAKALHDWGLSLDDLDDVMHGSDSYARDMLRYRWELEGIARATSDGMPSDRPPASPEDGGQSGLPAAMEGGTA